jgi:hypothetical protein
MPLKPIFLTTTLEGLSDDSGRRLSFWPPRGAPDGRGRYLLPHNRGLMRLDGSFASWTLQAAPDIGCVTCAAYHEGVTYVGGDKGLLIMDDDGEVTAQLGTKSGLPHRSVECLLSTGHGLVVATRKGTALLRGGNVSVIRKSSTVVPRAFTDLGGDVLWCDKEVVQWDGGGGIATTKLRKRDPNKGPRDPKAVLRFEDGATGLLFSRHWDAGFRESDYAPEHAGPDGAFGAWEIFGEHPPSFAARLEDGRWVTLFADGDTGARELTVLTSAGTISRTHELVTGSGQTDVFSMTASPKGVWILSNARYELELFAAQDL